MYSVFKESGQITERGSGIGPFKGPLEIEEALAEEIRRSCWPDEKQAGEQYQGS